MNFDLNVENYSRDELIEMFELPPNFTQSMVENKETQMKDSIINNKSVNIETRKKTINFLDEAKKIILIHTVAPKTNNSSGLQNDKFIQTVYNTNKQLQTTSLVDDKSTQPVQTAPVIPYSVSQPRDHLPGIINPIQRTTTLKNLNIDSRFRENYYSTSSTNFILNLPMTLSSVVSLTLNSIELPTTFLVISKQYGNNFFTVVVNGKPGIVNIPSGNYSAVTVMPAIVLALENLKTIDPDFANVEFAVNTNGYVANKFSGTSQTLVGFNGSQSPGSTLELNFQADRFGNYDSSTPLVLKFGWMLGFRNGVYINNVNYVSEAPVDLTGPKYLYLVVNDYNNNYPDGFYGLYNSSLLNKNILARITFTQLNQLNPNSVLMQNTLAGVTTPRLYFGPVDISSLTIQILDEYGRILDLNFMDFSLCLTITSLYINQSLPQPIAPASGN